MQIYGKKTTNKSNKEYTVGDSDIMHLNS